MKMIGLPSPFASACRPRPLTCATGPRGLSVSVKHAFRRRARQPPTPLRCPRIARTSLGLVQEIRV